MTYLPVCGIEVPVDVERYCTPDAQDVLAFYREWVAYGGRWTIQGYLCGFCSELEKYEASQGLPRKDRVSRIIEHFSPIGFGDLISRYS